MKHANIVPNEKNKTWRFRWWHVLICSVLIAALFITLSIGMGYARYTVETTPLEQSFQVKGDLFAEPAYVAVKRVPGEDTVLTSKDGNLKVTVPADAAGSAIDNAEYFVLHFTKQQADLNQYGKSVGQNVMDYELSLHSISFGDNADQLALVNDSKNSIAVELKVGHDATGFQAISPSASAAAYDYDATNGVLRFTGLNTLPGSNDERSKFAVSYDRAQITPDTSWYDASYDAFIIDTPAQLAGVAKLVNDGVADFAGKTVQLSGDISLLNADGSKYTWDPIGNADKPFKGSFDGDGHTISGLNLRYFDTVSDPINSTCGLFGMVIGDGTTSLSNVTLKNVSYSADLGGHNETDAMQAFGALVGRCKNCAISDVGVDGLTVSGSAKYVGGIAGIHYGDAQDISVSNCYVSAQVNGAYSVAGGIVGYGNGGDIGIQNSYFTGSFAPSANDAYCGGILGIGFSTVDKNYTINNCYADCDTDLIGHGYFGYQVKNGARTIEDEIATLGNNLVVGNSSWSGSNNSFTWYTYAYDTGYTEYTGTVEKSDACWFKAGLSHDDFLATIENGGSLPALSASSSSEPTTAPTVVPTAAPQATQAPATTAPATETPAEAATEA